MSTVTSQFKIVMTPETARQWLENYRYEYQRNVSKERATEYATAMSTGEWIDNGETLVLAIVNGGKTRVLVDGQTRLNAIVESGVSVPFTVNEVSCADDEEVARVYYTIDRGRARTYGDTYRTTNIADELGITQTWLNKAGGAVQFIATDFNRGGAKRPYSQNGLLSALRSYGDAIGRYVELMYSPDRSVSVGIQRSSTMAVGIVTLQYACNVYGDEKVEGFWRGIVENDGLRRGDPRKLAFTHLSTTRISSNRASAGSLVSAAYSARYIAQLFNAWVEGREYSETRGGNTKVYNASAPIRINGTPWKG